MGGGGEGGGGAEAVVASKSKNPTLRMWGMISMITVIMIMLPIIWEHSFTLYARLTLEWTAEHLIAN